MTLFLDGIPSAGGPRSRRSRGARVFCGLASLVSEVAWFVVSVKGRTSVAAGASAAVSSPRDYVHVNGCYMRTWNFKNLQHFHGVLHGHERVHVLGQIVCGVHLRHQIVPLLRLQHPQPCHLSLAYEQVEPRPCAQGSPFQRAQR